MNNRTHRNHHARPIALALSAILSVACAAEVEVVGDAANEGDVTPGAPTTPPGAPTPMRPPATVDPKPTEPPPAEPVACQPLCESFSDSGCMTQEKCLADCEQEQEEYPFNKAEEEAFHSCMENDPLCFMSIRDCMLGTLHPEPFKQRLTLQLEGFEDFEGMPVYAGLSHGNGLLGRHSTTVVKGRFVLNFEETLHVNSSRLVLFFIDSNGNGSCDNEDFVSADPIPATGPASAPVFELDLQRANLKSSPSMCAFI